MRQLLVLIPVLAVACGGSKPAPPPTAPVASPAADVQMICDQAKAAATRDAFASSVDHKLATEQGRNIFKAAGQAADDQKSATIKRGAAEVGVADWDCAAPLERLYGKQSAAAHAP